MSEPASPAAKTPSRESSSGKTPDSKKTPTPAVPELLLVVLSAGMPGAALAVALENLKNSSKSISTHKRRELFWNAYTKMISATSSIDGPAFCILLFRALPDGSDGEVELVELTKRQRGLVGGGCEVLGHKIKPLTPDGKPDPAAKSWCICWSEEEAAPAYEDLMHGEPCVCVAPDGVYVATRVKRALCKGLSAPLKTVKDVEACVAALAPDKPLKSLSMVGNDPPSCNQYNTFVMGAAAKLDKELPATIGLVATASADEAYAYFLQRRNAHLVAEAGKLLAQMLADAGKGLTPLICAGSQKECIVAYKNALMKRVYAHESMGKFISRVRQDGQVELHVIRGDVSDTEFGRYGSLVFELFYRLDLSTMS